MCFKIRYIPHIIAIAMLVILVIYPCSDHSYGDERGIGKVMIRKMYSADIQINTENTSQTYGNIKKILETYHARIDSVKGNSRDRKITISVSNGKNDVIHVDTEEEEPFFLLCEKIVRSFDDVTVSNIDINDFTNEYIENKRRVKELGIEYSLLEKQLNTAKSSDKKYDIYGEMLKVREKASAYSIKNREIDRCSGETKVYIHIKQSINSSKSKIQESIRQSFNDAKNVMFLILRFWWETAIAAVVICLIVITRKQISGGKG